MTERNGEPQDPTIDPAEVKRYRALAHMWWQPDGKLWPLHVLNNLRTGYIRERLADLYGARYRLRRGVAE